MKPYPPLATLYVASQLREAGVSVALFDAMLAEDEHAFAAMLREHQPRIVVLYEDNFNFLSKMCLSRMREAACTMIAMGT
ncbi:MAG: cobalamin B12-binding domain-containing protein, partial [Anaerolineae bacterium]|nr:cobalamin B12-binding domain-containing protein [Anaerolineae bacterium]